MSQRVSESCQADYYEFILIVVDTDKDNGIARLSGEQPVRNILVKKSKFRKTCFRDENNGDRNPSKARNCSLRVLLPWQIVLHRSALRLMDHIVGS